MLEPPSVLMVVQRSRRPRYLRFFASTLLAVLCSSLPAPSARSEPPSSTSSTTATKNEASRVFSEGLKAFEAGDFQRAAELFEQAYQLKPHHSALWNAARAWESSSHNVRAANLYAQYLREAPGTAPDRDYATARLQILAAKLGRIEVQAPDFQHLRVDDQPLHYSSVFVNPGSHLVEGRRGAQVVRKTCTVAAGDVTSLVLEVSSSPPTPSATPQSNRTSNHTTPEPRTSEQRQNQEPHGLSPWFVFAGGLATIAAAGITTWSGLDTLSAHESYDGTHDKLVEGKAKQTRTNVLVGATLGLGVLTGFAAFFWVDWHPKRSPVQLGLSADSLVVRGSF